MSNYSLSLPLMISVVVGTDGDSMDRVLMRCIELLAACTLVVCLVSTSCAVTSNGGAHTSSGSFICYWCKQLTVQQQLVNMLA